MWVLGSKHNLLFSKMWYNDRKFLLEATKYQPLEYQFSNSLKNHNDLWNFGKERKLLLGYDWDVHI